MSIGTVSWFGHSKGRRFIIPDDGSPHVVANFAKVMDADRCLDQHQCVRYCLGVSPQRPVARIVYPLR